MMLSHRASLWDYAEQFVIHHDRRAVSIWTRMHFEAQFMVCLECCRERRVGR